MSAGEGVWKVVEVRRFFSFQSAAVESAERLASGDGVLENGTPLVKELEGGKPLCMIRRSCFVSVWRFRLVTTYYLLLLVLGSYSE